MARIIGSLTTSHVPVIGLAVDQGKTQDAYWKPLFDGYEPARDWLKKAKPDVAIVLYNDHGTAFSLESVPTFAIGVADQFQPADEGWGPRPVPMVMGDPALAEHLVESLIFDEFDMTMLNAMQVDHGLTVPLSVTCGQPKEWPFKVIPISVNVIMYPQPTGLRCYKLGKAIRKAVEAYDKDLKVMVFGTGGMSHQLHGERAGLINKVWDKAFMDDITANPERLLKLKHVDYVRDAGAEGIELIMWLAARGALNEKAKEVYRHYHVPASNTAAGLMILQDG